MIITKKKKKIKKKITYKTRNTDISLIKHNYYNQLKGMWKNLNKMFFKQTVNIDAFFKQIM